MSSFYYRFDPAETGGATWFMVGGDEVAALDVPVAPTVGTEVSLPDGRTARVQSSRIDLSNSSDVAMVYVNLEIVDGA